VEFTINPPVGEIIQVRELRFIFEGGQMDMGSNDIRRFSTAAGTGGLTNGLEAEIVQGAMIQPIFVDPIQHMSQFFQYASDFFNVPDGVAVNVDLLTWVVDFKLLIPIPVAESSTDKVLIRVSDDLSSIDSFQCLATGQREPIDGSQ
jgi:hypothetical protein